MFSEKDTLNNAVGIVQTALRRGSPDVAKRTWAFVSKASSCRDHHRYSTCNVVGDMLPDHPSQRALLATSKWLSATEPCVSNEQRLAQLF